MAGRDERINKAVGAAITGAYGEAGLTLETLAERVALSPTTTQRIASGATSVKVSDFIKIAAAVDLAPEDLMERALRRLAKLDGMSPAPATPISLHTKRNERVAAETIPLGALEDQAKKAATHDDELDTPESESP